MKKTIIILSSALFLTSCLKDKEYDNGTIGHQVQDQKIVELALPNSSATSVTRALDYKNLESTLTFLPVRISSGSPAESDITVVLDTSGTTAYAAANGYAHFKNTLGSIVSPLSLTIPKGSLESNPIMLKVNPINFDPSAKYVIAFKIKSVSDPNYQINANFGTYYIFLGAKNPYDGVYSLTFSNYHPSSNPGYTGTTVDVYMITTAGNKVKIFFPDFDGYYNPAVLGGALSAFGAQEPEYTIDQATNQVTVQNAYPGATTFYTMNPTHNNRYDPATKKIYCRWGYSYVGGNFAPGTSREWTQEFTYTGPRP
ncbi:MAG: DUF1735 domain-containing protein [Chitinophagaceae bacterium]